MRKQSPEPAAVPGQPHFSAARWGLQLREVSTPGTEKYFGHSSQVLARLAAPAVSVAPLFSGSFHGAPALCADLSAGSAPLHHAAPADFPRRRIALRARAAELPGISHTGILQPASLANLGKYGLVVSNRTE